MLRERVPWWITFVLHLMHTPTPSQTVPGRAPTSLTSLALFTCLLFSTSLTPQLVAADPTGPTYVWTGATGGADDFWNRPANWLNSIRPVPSNNSIIRLSADEAPDLASFAQIWIPDATTVRTNRLELKGKAFFISFLTAGSITITDSINSTGHPIFQGSVRLLFEANPESGDTVKVSTYQSEFSSLEGPLDLSSFSVANGTKLELADSAGLSLDYPGIALAGDFSTSGPGGITYRGGYMTIEGHDSGPGPREVIGCQIHVDSLAGFSATADYLKLENSKLRFPLNYSMGDTKFPPLRIAGASSLSLGSSSDSAQILDIADSSLQSWTDGSSLTVYASELFGIEPGSSSTYQLIRCKITSSQASRVVLSLGKYRYRLVVDQYGWWRRGEQI